MVEFKYDKVTGYLVVYEGGEPVTIAVQFGEEPPTPEKQAEVLKRMKEADNGNKANRQQPSGRSRH